MKKYFILAAVAATFAACSFDKDMGESSSQIAQEEKIPLTIGYTVGTINDAKGTTRSNTDAIQNTRLISTNQLGLFILKEDGNTHTSTEAYEQLNLTSTSVDVDNPTTDFFHFNSGSTTLSYPDAKSQGIDIYAYAPYQSGTVSNITSDFITINTATDQTSQDNYMASDVLWGCAGAGNYVDASITTGGAYKLLNKETNANNNSICANTYMTAKSASAGLANGYYSDGSGNADVVVPMLHRGCKIIMNITTSGMDYTKLRNAEVYFKVDHTNGRLKISDGTYAIPSTETTPAASATTIKLTTHLGIEEPSATPTAEGEYDPGSGVAGYTCSAVIVPQTNTTANNSGNDAIIEIKLKENTSDGAIGTGTPAVTATATYAWKTGNTTPTTFVSGKKYIYDIVVKATGLSVTTSVQDWVTDNDFGTSGTTGGNADLQ